MKPTNFFNIYTAVVAGVVLSVISAVFIVSAQQSYLTNKEFVSQGRAIINQADSASPGLEVYKEAKFHNNIAVGTGGIGDLIIKRNGLCSTDGTQTNCRALVNYGNKYLYVNYNNDFASGTRVLGDLELGDANVSNLGQLQWPANLWGGTGDQASIRYERQGTSGENTVLTISNENDAGDGISIDAGYIALHSDLNGQISINDNLQVQQDTFSHWEEHKSGSVTEYYRYGWCYDNSFSRNNIRLAGSQGGSLSDIFSKAFAINQAQAKNICYGPEVMDCWNAGCTYCLLDDYCTYPTPYACSSGMGGCAYNDSGDATCDPHDTKIQSWNGNCCGVSYVSKVKCQHATSDIQTDYFTKLEFVGSGDGTAPNTRVPSTIIHDNLIVNGNEWGDGDDSAANCTYLTGNECADGEFMAGYNNANDQIYCCKL